MYFSLSPNGQGLFSLNLRQGSLLFWERTWTVFTKTAKYNKKLQKFLKPSTSYIFLDALASLKTMFKIITEYDWV